MESNVTRIGKIRKIDKEKCIGEIVASDGVYKFTMYDIFKDNFNNFKEGEIVKFRAEIVQGYKRAFFVRKENLNKEDYTNNNYKY